MKAKALEAQRRWDRAHDLIVGLGYTAGIVIYLAFWLMLFYAIIHFVLKYW